MAIPLQSSSLAPSEMSHCLSAAFHELEGATLRKWVLIRNAHLAAISPEYTANEVNALSEGETQHPSLPQDDEASFFDELLDELSGCSSDTSSMHEDAQNPKQCQDGQSGHTLFVSMADKDTALKSSTVVAFCGDASSPSYACDEVYGSDTAHNDCRSDSCDDLPSLIADSQDSIDEDLWEDVLNYAIEATPCHALETMSNQTRKAPVRHLISDYNQLSAAESSP